MKSFWLEVKSVCKSFKFLALILVLLCLQIVLLGQLQQGEETESLLQQQKHIFYRQGSANWEKYWENYYNYMQRLGEPNPRYPYSSATIESNLAWYQFERKLGDGILQYYGDKNWPTYSHHMAEKRLLEWDIQLAMVDPRNPYIPITSPEEYFGDDWLVYSDMLDRLEFQELPVYIGERLRTVESPEYIAFSTAAFLQLHQEELPPHNQYSSSPWGFLFNFLRKGLPPVLGIIVLLMTVNMVHQEKKSGTAKVNLQYPKGRGHYLMRKTVVGFVSSLLTITLPLLAVFLYLGKGQGFQGLNLPVLLEKNLWQWAYHSEHVRLIRWAPSFTFKEVGLSQFAPSYNGWDAILRVDTVPLWQFMLLALVMLLLFTLFCTVLGIFISTLIKNEIFAQVTALGIFILGSSYASFFPLHSTNAWDLFAKADVIPLLEGNHLTTYLASGVALALATIILFLLSLLTFRRQDITS